MRFDSYATPDAESLLRKARLRFAATEQERRILRTEAVAAAVFVLAAVAIATTGSSQRALSAVAVAVSVLAYVAAEHVTFPVAAGWTRPTQLVFVPILFVLPLPAVPLMVMVSLLLGLWPQAISGRLSPALVLGRIADGMYVLGPVLVLLAAHMNSFSWARWPVLLAALGAQFAVDSASAMLRDWFAEGTPPSSEVSLLWAYLTDACLSCVGLLVAASAARRPGLMLLALPLLAVLGLLARERKQRLDGTLELSTAYRGTALLLGDVVEGNHEYTGMHSREVVDLSVAVADAMGLDADCRRHVEFAALLHDVGKLRVPVEIINKPGKLDEAEWAVMRRHTIEGEAMLRQVGGMLARVGAIVRASHEHFDGGGYPDGLAGEQIPIESRIVSACDAYSAMTTDRSYRKAMSVELAVAELRRCAGTQFDPVVVEALIGAVATEVPARPAAELRTAVSLRAS